MIQMNHFVFLDTPTYIKNPINIMSHIYETHTHPNHNPSYVVDMLSLLPTFDTKFANNFIMS